MSYKLRKDEVQHELKVRGLTTDGDLYELKKRLQLAYSDKTPIDNEAVKKLDHGLELENCEEKYSDLVELVDAFDSSAKTYEYLRLEARSSHLLTRLQLIDDIKEDIDLDETLKNRLSSLIEKIKVMKEQLEKKICKTPDVYHTDQPQFPIPTEDNITLKVPILRIPESSSKKAQEENLVQSESENQKVSSRESDFYRKSVPVYKWNLKFDGIQNLSIGSFLERVEELRISRGISEKELLESAVDLFSGSALVWHRSNRQRIKSWQQMKTELRAVFQNPDYDHLLLKEILNRTQGEHENIDLYLAAMDGLYSRLTEKISEEKQLSQILKNLNNYLQDKLCMFNINSLEELRNLARRAELGRIRSATQHPPPRPNLVLEPDLAYTGHRRQPTSQYVSAVNSVDQPRKYDRKCWNCNEEGHLSMHCEKPKKLHCYGCGTPNIRKSDCQRCNSKNLLRREPK